MRCWSNSGAIRTLAGGSIDVTAELAMSILALTTMASPLVWPARHFYRVNANNLGGISTAAGGNVFITAGRDVISYLPIQTGDPTIMPRQSLMAAPAHSALNLET